ncbi:Ectoine TRAP transporter small permease protein TeaB [bioreactor metagenome]|uniref:Ectoine TRAP transporter small permease protein TeaB n=1 Tax=bioreactor metagenome TaxID=1076179 RepID=A0A645EXP8_9ZZZZ
MEGLAKFNGYIKKFEEFILSYSILLMAIILVANVIGRLVFNHSLKFAEEAGSMLTLIVTFIGVSYCARVGRHIIMTVFFDIMPPKGKKLFLFISSSFTTACLLYLTYLSSNYIMGVYNTGRVTPALGLPMWIPYMFVPLGFLLGALQYLVILLLNITDKTSYHTCIDPIPDETADPEIFMMDREPMADEAPETDPQDSKE